MSMATPATEVEVYAELEQVGTLEEITEFTPIGERVLAHVHELAVTDDESYNYSLDLQGRVRSARKAIETHRTQRTGPINQALKLINADHKVADKPFADSDDLLTRTNTAYHRKRAEKAAKEAARQAKLLEARQAKEEARAEEAGEEPRLVATSTPTAAPPLKSTYTDSGATATMREERSFKITDEAKIPREYWMVDLVRIGKIYRAGGEVEGCELVVELVPSFRGV